MSVLLPGGGFRTGQVIDAIDRLGGEIKDRCMFETYSQRSLHLFCLGRQRTDHRSKPTATPLPAHAGAIAELFQFLEE